MVCLEEMRKKKGRPAGTSGGPGIGAPDVSAGSWGVLGDSLLLIKATLTSALLPPWDRWRSANEAGKLAAAAVLLFVGSVCGQNLLTNGDFSLGKNRPVGWTLPAGANGSWGGAADGREGRFVSVRGDGSNSFAWQSEEQGLGSGGWYRLHFKGRTSGGVSGGCVVAGANRANRDFQLDSTWREYDFLFQTPYGKEPVAVRLGQWQQKGEIRFAGVQLYPVRLIQADTVVGELGEGEGVSGGVYRFEAGFGGDLSYGHRTLATNHCGFNSDRWVFSAGDLVVYQHGLSGREQRSARVRIALNHFVAGELFVEARTDNSDWLTIDSLGDKKRACEVQLPGSLFPCRQAWVRLRAAAPRSELQVNSYQYEAQLTGAVADAEGATWISEVTHQSPSVEVKLRVAQRQGDGGDWVLPITITNQTDRSLKLEVEMVADTNAAPRRSSLGRVAPLTAIQRELGWKIDGAGQHRLRFDLIDSSRKDGSPRTAIRGEHSTSKSQPQAQSEATSGVVLSAKTEVTSGFLADMRPGYWLAGNSGMEVWWCESGWKIGKERRPPDKPKNAVIAPVRIELARAETEAAQVVLSPRQDCELLKAEVSFRARGSSDEEKLQVRLHEVAYVKVTRPTDRVGSRDWYPDPLPALATPMQLKAKSNQPLWVSIHAGLKVAAGDHRGELVLTTTIGKIRVPLVAHVFSFALPDQTHLRSAFGFSTGTMARYHGLKSPEQKAQVYARYLDSFAEHRISPYSFFDYAPIDIRFEGTGSDRVAKVDFSRFDEAARVWLDQRHFSTFLLPLRGMGGGTFQSRYLGELEGFKEGTPEHARLFRDYLEQVERHLRERGWLDRAFTYWFDEPDPKDYEFVVDGMKRIKAAAPGIKRMLTEQPEPALLGNVEIWCGLTPEWSKEKVRARRAAGEEVWWYVCTGPKAPYVTLFIDHPATELRLWSWQSWQYGVQGLLVWESDYWNSPAAFKAPALQNPWIDPMSYVSGYDFQPGHVGYWGNGDGRFLYPPRRDYTNESNPSLDGPVVSMRWEFLRDGIEDYEYFWLLNQAIDQMKLKQPDSGLVKEAQSLLEVPATVSLDLTHFTDDPRPMLIHRRRIAEMIERASNGRR
jgi:hypothetical protein